MANPLRGFRYLPWADLFKAAFLAVFIVAVLDWLLIQVGIRSELVENAIVLLYAPPLGIVIGFAVAFCLGSLSVFLLERLCRQPISNHANLWGLLLCLLVVLMVKSWFVEGLLLHSQQLAIIGAIFGVFLFSRTFR